MGGGHQSIAEQGPPQAVIDQLINLYNQGQLEVVVEQAQNLTSQNPEAVAVWNILGASAAQIGKLDQAVRAFEQIIILNPNKASSHYNLGNALKDQGKLEEAIEAYNKALVLKPDYEAALNNLGVALQNWRTLSEPRDKFDDAIGAYNKVLTLAQANAEAHFNEGQILNALNKWDEAIASYYKAIAIKPDYAKAYFNMGVALTRQDKLEEAIVAYSKALSLEPDHAEAMTSLLSLNIQLSGTTLNTNTLTDQPIDEAVSRIVQNPTHQIHKAIYSFLFADMNRAHLQIEEFNNCDHQLIADLVPQDRDFCFAFRTFLTELMKEPFDKSPNVGKNKMIYHLGESHCLSFAHRSILMGGWSYNVEPMITLGAKAYHFSRTISDRYKAITRANFKSIPNGSEVWISFGEIDCRPNEGFIKAATKLKKSTSEVISNAVIGYLRWFDEQNKTKKHRVHIFNVPAPIYDKNRNSEINDKATNAVVLTCAPSSLQLCSESLGLNLWR